MSDKIRAAQLQFLRQLAEDYQKTHSQESLDARNTLFLASLKSDDLGESIIDSGFVRFLTDSQLKIAVSLALHRLGYAAILDLISFRLSFDAGDRGESGFAPSRIATAGMKAGELLLAAQNLLKKNPPTPY